MSTTHDTSQGHDISLLTEHWAGVHVSEYIIKRCVDVGNHNILFEAIGADLMHRIAIKIPAHIGDGERLIRERLAIEELSGVTIIPGYVMHGRCEDGRPLLAMEWIAGVSLARQLRLEGSLTRHDYLDFMLQLVSGLSAIHARGFATHNLNTSNIIIDMGRVRLVDMGCTTHIREPRPHRLEDPRHQDLLMLGKVLHATLGDAAEHGEQGKFRCGESVPQSLWSLIRRCESHNPTYRPDMHEIERLLKRMLEHSQVSSSTAVTADDAPTISSGRSKIFTREATRLNAHSPADSVELLRQTHQEATRPRQRQVLLDAQARERLRKRFKKHLETD